METQLVTHCFGHAGLHDNPWLCDCQISMVTTLSMSVGSPVVLMDQLLMCSRSLVESGMLLLTQAQLSRCMRPSVQPAATRVVSPLGSNVILRCDATGYPTPTLTWIKSSASTGEQSRTILEKKQCFPKCEGLVVSLDCCREAMLDSDQLPRNLESCK